MPEEPGCGGCNPSRPLPPDALTVREWEARYAARQETETRPRLRHRIGERLAALVVCPACLLPRFVPSHWWTCRG